MDYKTIFSNDTHLDIIAGLIVPLSKINKLVLGTLKQFPIIEKMTLLNSGIIIEMNDKYYLKLNNFITYLDLIKNQIDNNLIFPYNYYKIFFPNETDITYNLVFETIDKYIEYLDKQNDHFSKTIKYIIYYKNILQANIVSELDGLYCLNFEKKGKSLPLNLFSEEIDSVYSLCYTSNNDNKYKKLFEEHKNFLLMDNPETFLITNLQRVTGDEAFSTMVVKSYLIKNEFTTSIEELCHLIEWKNKHMKDLYLIKFYQKYSHLIKNDNTNFEGINKFLLNIEIEDVNQWHVKEQINELYYQITHELIRSFELLYNSKIF